MRKFVVPSSVTPPSVERFLAYVLRSGVLARDELDDTLRDLPASERYDSPFLAEFLIKRGRLTKFQALKLLQGATVGLILGPYQILSPLGKGGMGRVYLARDQRSRQLVALKVLPPKKAKKKKRYIARFQREMSLSQLIDHPHLARTLDAGVHEGIYYIAMEYIPGKNIYQIVNRDGPLAVPRAARLFAEVCLGLEHAHQRGLVHRDLKPSNIIITPNDHAKVLDLGLAIMQGEEPTDRTVVGGQGYIVGTMDYLAPEQAEDALQVDARTDIYSLGCALFFALTGRPPFFGGTTAEKIRRHFTEEPALVCQLNPEVPPAFEAILRKMIAKRPEARYASAAAIRQELLPWATNEPNRPLDSRDDTAVVADLEKMEETPDSSSEDEDMVVGRRPTDGKSSLSLFQPSDKAMASPTLRSRLSYYVPLGLATLFLLAALVLLLKK